MKKYGGKNIRLNKIKIDGDGNCGYYSILYGLQQKIDKLFTNKMDFVNNILTKDKILEYNFIERDTGNMGYSDDEINDFKTKLIEIFQTYNVMTLNKDVNIVNKCIEILNLSLKDKNDSNGWINDEFLFLISKVFGINIYIHQSPANSEYTKENWGKIQLDNFISETNNQEPINNLKDLDNGIALKFEGDHYNYLEVKEESSEESEDSR